MATIVETAGRRRRPAPVRAAHPRAALAGNAASFDAAKAKRLAKLGFDTVVLACEAASPLEWTEAVRIAAGTARAAKLALWLDLDLASVPLAYGQAGVQQARRTSTAPLPDPRLAPTPVDAGLDFAQFVEAMAALGQDGVAGWRCLSPQRLHAMRWQTLMAAAPGAWVAWTPGLASADVLALRDAGFTAVVSSLPWWDGEARWWDEEFDRLRSVTPLLMPVLATPQTEALPALLRCLALASHLGDGVLVDMQREARFGALLGAAHNDESGLADALVAALVSTEGAGSAIGWRRAGFASSGATALLGTRRNADGERTQLVLINPDLAHARPVAAAALQLALGDLQPLGDDDALAPLDAAAVRVFPLQRRDPAGIASRRRAPLADAIAAPRVAIESVSPCIDSGRFPARRIVGDTLQVRATIFSDGHERLGAQVTWRAPGETRARTTPMRDIGNDTWCAELPLDRVGRLVFAVEAWRDAFATVRSDIDKKRAADTLLALDVDEAVAIVAEAQPPARSTDQRACKRLLADLQDGDTVRRTELLLAPETATLMARTGPRRFLARSSELAVDVERKAAGFAAWYELFPRSLGGADKDHGDLDDVIAQLPRIAAMGFDVLYMPPIHPIGRTHRKGRNNTLGAGPDQPGSPYAIGSEEGGHDALHPQLGDFNAFARLIDAAKARGMEVALDFAIQCSPDHPWLREHPEWFSHRADGSIRHAENPPKRYEDIVNVEFYAGVDDAGLWTALRDVVMGWVQRGVRLFRVDNPHTKPMAFWEWMIADVRGRDPDVVFLSEAFTRPAMMYRLAKLGFSQSYTYFTWRNTKRELTAYFEELDRAPPSEFFRPHLFVNTPDINPRFLQDSGRAGHRVRAVLAATLSGLWGVYAPFELCDATPLPGKEEYLDSEKYERRDWDWQTPERISDDLTRLNTIRRANPALHSHRHVQFLHADNDNILFYAKRAPGTDEIVLVAVNLDPHAAHGATIEVPLWQLGLPDDGLLAVDDLWHGHRFTWRGKHQHIHLDPARQGFALWRIRPHTEPSA